MIYKNINITITVKDNITETAGYRSVILERPQGFKYQSGDWIDVQFGEQRLQGGSTYSLSSSPTEPDLMITFKDGLSEVKQALRSLKPGDTLNIIQYGNDYTFTLKPHKPGVLIAGGVGIAPFRSMLKEMHDVGSSSEIALIYLNKTSDFIFMNELDEWLKKMPDVSMTTVITSNITKKERIKILAKSIVDTDCTCYIAGPEAMVENTEHILLDLGVRVDAIKIDSFSGY